MTVGILVCDRVRPDLRSIQGDYPDMFAALLPKLQLRAYYVCENEFPTQASDCAAWLVTGSRHSVYETIDWIQRLQSFVRNIHEADIPFVGLCFGHQLLAESLGGKVAKAATGWCVGIHEFQMKQQESWMQPYQSLVQLPMMCQDQVQQLPPNSRLLAFSASCPFGMFRVGERMLGIQAHPEFSKAYDRALMMTRTERIGAEKVATAEASFALDSHQYTVGQWISQFLQQLQ